MVHLLLFLLVAVNDPRAELVELQSQGKYRQALARVQSLQMEEPDEARRWGLDYLKGHLHDLLDEPEAAKAAFANAIAATPKLRGHARYRIAINEMELKHPEVAAGLTATLLGERPPKELIDPASRLLTATLAQGGDCRLISTLSTSRFPSDARRRIELARADCALRSGDSERSKSLLVNLLREKSSDMTGLLAAQKLSKIADPLAGPRTPNSEWVSLLGNTYHHHRQFDRSNIYLQQIVVGLAPTVGSKRDFELRYRLGRSHFWQGQYQTAAERYGDLAGRTPVAQQQSQALYHQGRALELAGLWDQAAEIFKRTYQSHPQGNFAGPGLIGALRIAWRSDRQDEGLQIYQVLRSLPNGRSELGRAAIFLAASDIVEGRADRAQEWLSDAASAARNADLEIGYWQGRLAELRGDPPGALDRYIRILRKDFFHPISQQALERLKRPELARQVEQRTRLRISRGDRPSEALVLLERGTKERDAAIAALQRKLLADNRGREFTPSEAMPIADWPIFKSPLVQPEEILLALGIFADGSAATSNHFPMSEPALALAAAKSLIQAGLPRKGLLIAEILHRRVPGSFPQAALPREFREVLYPLPYRNILETATKRFNLHPSTLAGIIREESRWERTAVSAASARGLTQFVYPTAVRIAQKIGMGKFGPADLERPEVAITLGAAYVDELRTAYAGATHQAIAAYNAGEAQSQLWRRYCSTDDPAEYYSKVAFRETRNYLGRVLSSAAQYRDLYY